MSKRAPVPLTRMIAIARIDPPAIAMRETMSDTGLESLAASLLEVGQLQAIGVIEEADRFRVVWGHRRRVAAERAGLAELECKVFPAGTPNAEAMKFHENAEQEPVNIAAEATYYFHLYSKVCGEDVDQVAALVRKPVSRVLDRLDLLRGDPAVLQALRDDSISFAVARLLNQCKHDGYRALFLSDAIRQGATARTVQSWVDDVKRQQRIHDAATEAGVSSAPAIAIPSIVNMDACVICGKTVDQHEMEYRKVHQSCHRYMQRQLESETPGGSAT